MTARTICRRCRTTWVTPWWTRTFRRPTSGTIDTKKRAPGKVIYGEGLTFKGGSHGSTLQIIPKAKAQEMASKLPPVPKSPSNHWKNFLLAARARKNAGRRSPWPDRCARPWPWA